MRTAALCFVAILKIAAALPLENVAVNTDVNVRDSALEQLLLDIIEGLRETMVTGSDDFPVMDPLEIDQLHLELDDLGLPGSHITLEDAEARQLSTFVIDDLSLTLTNLLLQRYTLDLVGHIPVIEVDCDKYNLNVHALGLNIFGAGSAKIRVINPRIVARIEVALSIFGGISVNIRSSDVVFYLEGFEPEITGLFGNDNTNDFINAFLGNLVPQLVELYQPEISDFINSIIEGIGSIDLTRQGITNEQINRDFVEITEIINNKLQSSSATVKRSYITQ